jgi:nucleoside-diphosphate-sugar epimerase
VIGLIGHTGFVGSNLARQIRPDRVFNSSTIGEIRGARFDLLVNAGVSSLRWKANAEPEADRAAVLALWRELETVEADVCVHVSTFDVIQRNGAVDEDTPIDESRLEPYGLHRLELERLVRNRFDRHLVVRLPHPFGPGLRKGFVYDLLHDNALELTDRRDVFQLYDLANLWRDVEAFLAAGWELTNVTSAPVTAEELAREAFGREFATECERPPRRYDVRTRLPYRAAGRTGYMYERGEALEALVRFVHAQAA